MNMMQECHFIHIHVYYMKYKNKISAQNAKKKNGASWLKQHLKNASCSWGLHLLQLRECTQVKISTIKPKLTMINKHSLTQFYNMNMITLYDQFCQTCSPSAESPRSIEKYYPLCWDFLGKKTTSWLNLDPGTCGSCRWKVPLFPLYHFTCFPLLMCPFSLFFKSFHIKPPYSLLSPFYIDFVLGPWLIRFFSPHKLSFMTFTWNNVF